VVCWKNVFGGGGARELRRLMMSADAFALAAGLLSTDLIEFPAFSILCNGATC
jgi:hypothetical protein